MDYYYKVLKKTMRFQETRQCLQKGYDCNDALLRTVKLLAFSCILAWNPILKYSLKLSLVI